MTFTSLHTEKLKMDHALKYKLIMLKVLDENIVKISLWNDNRQTFLTSQKTINLKIKVKIDFTRSTLFFSLEDIAEKYKRVSYIQ